MARMVMPRLSKRYMLTTKLRDSHTVKVMATLFLLSYAKVLQTVITVGYIRFGYTMAMLTI